MPSPDDDKKPDESKAPVDGKPEVKPGVADDPQAGAAQPAKAEDDAGVDQIEVSELPGDEPASTSISTLALPPTTEPSKIDEAQEKTRGYIALALVGILLLIIIASFVTLWWTSLKLTDVKGLLEVILAPVVALVGSATGFYFGGKK